MGKTNRDWHLAHRMPPNPTQAQRAQWHAEHQQQCGCRAPSDKEQALIDAWRRDHSSD